MDARVKPGHDESKLHSSNIAARLLSRLGSRSALGGDAALYHSYRPNRAFVKRDQRQSQRHLAQHVRRGEDGGDDEGNDDKVAALRLELIRGNDADSPKQRQNDRKLE